MSLKKDETAEQLKIAVALSHVGQTTKVKARQLFKRVIRVDPHNEAAWLGFVNTLSSDAQRIKALERCLEFNPDSQTARSRLEEIKAQVLELEIRAAKPELELRPQPVVIAPTFRYQKPANKYRIFRGTVIFLGTVTVLLVAVGLILLGNGSNKMASSTPGATLELAAVLAADSALVASPPADTSASNVGLNKASIVQRSILLGPVGLCSPLEGFKLAELPEIMSDNYHPPPPGHDGRHMGVDFAFYRYGDRMDIRDVYIRSILPGKVAGVIIDRLPYGNAVIIETRAQDIPEELARVLKINAEQSLYHLYAHMANAPWVDVGQLVSLCHLLGQVGNTGATVAPHLHLETRFGPPGEVLSSLGCCGTYIPEGEQKEYFYWVTSGVFRHFDPMTIFKAFQDYSQ